MRSPYGVHYEVSLYVVSIFQISMRIKGNCPKKFAKLNQIQNNDSDYCIVNTTEPPAYDFRPIQCFCQIILNAKHSLLFTPAHCMKQIKHCTSTVSS